MTRITMVGLCFVAAAACSGSPTDDAGAQIATPLLFKLQHIDVSPKGLLSVYANGDWTFDSYDTCSKLQGMLSEAERSALTGYLDDPSLEELAADVGSCPAESFELSRRNNAAKGSYCWKNAAAANPKARAAVEGLTRFYEARIDALQWDGTVKDCSGGAGPGSGGPPPRKDASGSPAPVPVR